MARIIEGLITGMGFIGGGAILRLKDSVKGTATSASLWTTGAIGVSVGLGRLDVALMLSVATIATLRSEEHTSELQSLTRISYAVFCLKKKKKKNNTNNNTIINRSK